jgi:hypothetical protein
MEEIGIAPASTSQATAPALSTQGDTFVQYKKLQQQLEFLNTMEEYVVRTLLLTTER